jgi:hypothetical protein
MRVTVQQRCIQPSRALDICEPLEETLRPHQYSIGKASKRAPETPGKPYDEMSKQEQEDHDRAARAKEQADQDGTSFTPPILIFH